MWLTFAGGHMRTNVLYMLKSMDKRDVGLQLALQCAPVITGIKVSNLFIIDKNMVEELYDIIDGTDISAFFFTKMKLKQIFFYTERRNFSSIFWEKKIRNLSEILGMKASILTTCCLSLQ